MTFRERLTRDRPEMVGLEHMGGCRDCPSDYGYEAESVCSDNAPSERDCAACWDREMPEAGEGCDTNDPVIHPAHYTSGRIECIDAITSALVCHKDPISAWLTGQIIKYMWRWPLKGGAEDLKKARFYLDRLIVRETGP